MSTTIIVTVTVVSYFAFMAFYVHRTNPPPRCPHCDQPYPKN